MKFGLSRINNYLAAAAFLILMAGCSSPEERKQKKLETVVHLHLESEFDTGSKTDVVPIYRASPIPVRIYKQPFLDSANLIDAQVVDTVGGFAIRLAFDFHGQLALENVSTSYKGSRIAIQAVSPEVRWLAAPKINARITDGTLAFTPDATREEAEKIVRGLNNLAVKLGNRPKSPAKPKKD
jgi:preprotein translocase subunit SecD